MRRDVIVEDIAPNIRHVTASLLHSCTVTIAREEWDEFREWCSGAGLTITQEHCYGGPTGQFIFMLIEKSQVMQLKLAWSRWGSDAKA